VPVSLSVSASAPVSVSVPASASLSLARALARSPSLCLSLCLSLYACACVCCPEEMWGGAGAHELWADRVQVELARGEEAEDGVVAVFARATQACSAQDGYANEPEP